MRVGLDARKLHDFGIGTYLRGLLQELPALGSPEELVVYLPTEAARHGSPLGGRPGVTLAVEGSAPYSARELLALPLQMARHRLSLFHAPHYVLPPLRPCPAVVTIHDLIHLRFPDQLPSPLAPLYARVMFRIAVRSARRIIAVSEATARDLAERLGASPGKVRVIPNGVDGRFRPAADPAALDAALARLGLERPYLLFVGNPKPHKNLPRLLDAFAGLDPKLGRLVLAGTPERARPGVEREVGGRGLGERVRVLGVIAEETMPVLYQGAELLVLPSLWEGFGLPALEAMATGTPVVATDRGGLPEVVGEAGLLVDPTNVDALRAALYNLLVDLSLRDELRARGLARARTFSWRRVAEATAAVYREARG
ncbi:MAG: glycosyltransferase family 4 protein [Candidatus Rokubacteria bacterium]|nr:glycosyltransferase family 4 protein [Candidatus Rokubacteria bacterium]